LAILALDITTCMIRASLDPVEEAWVEQVFPRDCIAVSIIEGVERAIRDIESDSRISSVFRSVWTSQKYGSGGWTFGSHTGPSNHRLRVESFDQSQGYEPCGLNLATPPRYKRGSGFNWF